METNVSSLLDMANGAIKERLDYEMGRVIQNIGDPNTKAAVGHEPARPDGAHPPEEGEEKGEHGTDL